MSGHQHDASGTVREEQRALVETRRVIASAVLFLLSVVALFLYTTEASTSQIESEFLSVMLLSLVAILFPRLFSFFRQVRRLSIDAIQSEPSRSGKQEVRRALATAVMLMLLTLAPFLLTRFLYPLSLIVVVTACIAGYYASEILFATCVSYWQMHTRTNFKRYRLWAVRPDGRRVLLESGVRKSHR